MKIGGTFAGSPEAIYKAYAREILNVKRELTDLEKTQARYYAVLQAGEAAEGAAVQRMTTNIGKIDKLSSALSDVAGKLATGAINSDSFSSGLSTSAKAVEILTLAIERLSAAEAKRRPPGESASNIEKFAYNATTHPSRRYSVLNAPFTIGADVIDWAHGRSVKGRSLSERFDSLAGSVGGVLGLDLGNPLSRLASFDPASVVLANAQRYLSAGKSPLDTRVELNRDPFAWASVAEQNAANAPGILARQRRAFDENRRFAGGIVPGLTSAYGGIIGAGDRLAALGGISGETPQQRAARVFTLSGSVATDAAEAYRIGGYSSTEARSMAEAEARRFRISSLGNVAPGELSADQEAAYREDLRKYQEDQLKQARDTLLEAVRMRKALEKMAGKLVPDVEPEPEPVILQIDNRSDTTARFASLIASGDTLRSDDR